MHSGSQVGNENVGFSIYPRLAGVLSSFLWNWVDSLPETVQSQVQSITVIPEKEDGLKMIKITVYASNSKEDDSQKKELWKTSFGEVLYYAEARFMFLSPDPEECEWENFSQNLIRRLTKKFLKSLCDEQTICDGKKTLIGMIIDEIKHPLPLE